jgi:hypothetical protein
MGAERVDEIPGERDATGELTFANIVLMFGTTALVHLGAAGDPAGGEQRVDLEQAKQVIEMLDVLKQKTAGNLTDQETRILDGILFDLRMRYVEAIKGK